MTTETYVQTIDHNATGGHWDTLRPVDDYLREHVEDMAAALRISWDAATVGDIMRLELECEPDVPTTDTVTEQIESWYLEVAIAKWTDAHGDHAPFVAGLCRVELVTGTGGPHCEIIGQYSRAGWLQRIEAHQYWSGHREAWTDDPRLLDTFAAFVEAFIAPE